MRRGDGSVFERLAATVKARDIQRKFAFTWNDAGSERALLKHYIEQRGTLARDPVLLCGEAFWEASHTYNDYMPYGVWFPEKALAEYTKAGVLDEEAFGEDGLLQTTDSEQVVEFYDEQRPFVSADASLLDLIENPPSGLEKRGAVIVLDGSEWTGAITPDEMMSPPARLCLLALILDLESTAMDLCRLFPRETFASLSESRQTKARDTWLQRYLIPRVDRKKLQQATSEDDVFKIALEPLVPFFQRLDLYSAEEDGLAPFESLYIDCTNLTDKSRMLCKCKMTIELSNSRIRSVFGRAEKLRNRCAHPGLDSETMPYSIQELRELVHDIIEMTDILRDSFVAECRARKINPQQMA